MITSSSNLPKRGYSEVEAPTNDARKKCAPNPLHTIGYEVFRAAITIPPEVLAEVQKQANHATPIFNHNESTKNDRKRCQVTLKKCNRIMTDFINSLNKFLAENVSAILKPSSWVAIRSKPGCQDQAAHCDYIPDAALQSVVDDKIPLAVLVSMMPGTKLNCWPGSIRLASVGKSVLNEMEPIGCQVEELGIGDILVFRGDFVHAGSAYANEHIRLHTYLDSDEVSRTPNRTWVIHQHANEDIQRVIEPKMLEFAARHDIKPIVEKFPLNQVNQAMAQLRSGKMHYRAILVP